MSWAQDTRTDFTRTAAHQAEVAALTAAGGATQIGDIIDLGGAQDLGAGTPVNVACMFQTAYAASGSGTLTLAVQASNSATFASGNITAWSSGVVAEADIIKGTKLHGRVRNQSKRYLRLLGTAGTEDATAGDMYSGFMAEIPEAKETTTPVVP